MNSTFGGDNDPVFLSGLNSLLDPLIQSGASEEEIADLKQRAWQFYTSRNNSVPEASQDVSESLAPTEVIEDLVAPSTPAEQPPYPISFAELASLIASGAEIPGIKEIPDLLADGSPSTSTIKAIKKPWEKDESN